MADPWDIPPFASSGDKTPNRTYEAVGCALSAWEELEVGLSYLFGIFTGKNPLSMTTYAEYGEPTIFALRADALQRTAERYFIGRPSQELEAFFGSLMYDARAFSARRNDIAHGVVRPIQVAPPSPVPDVDPSEGPFL
jgi:hypothetical protein